MVTLAPMLATNLSQLVSCNNFSAAALGCIYGGFATILTTRN
jgi:hypothetical protein